jgi:hypothetical protein
MTPIWSTRWPICAWPSVTEAARMATVTELPGIPSVHEVRVRLRRARRAHSDRTIGELLTDVYIVAFLVVLYGGSGAVLLRRHIGRTAGGPVGLATTREWLVLALLVLLGILVWRGLRALGPLITTPAVQTWCLSTPIDRSQWLRTSLIGVLIGAGIAGGLIGAVGAWLGLNASVWWAALIGAGAGVAVGALSVVAQARQGGRERRGRISDIALILATVLVTAAVVTRVTHITVGPPAIPGWALAAVAVVVAVFAVRQALRSLGQVNRAALIGGAQLAGAAASAVIMLDPSLFAGLVEARRWRLVGRVHSRRWIPGGRLFVLLQADIVRQWRRKSGIVAWAALILAPYAVGVFAPAWVGSTRIIAGYLAAERLAAGLRVVARSASLRRQLGGSNGDLKLIHMAVPTLGLILWWLATLGAGAPPSSPLLAALLVIGSAGAVYRTSTRKPMEYDTGTANTPLGPIPTTLLRRLLAGPDLVAILVLINLYF